MSGLASVRVTVTVDVAPDVAFKVFTTEFDEWNRSGSAALGPHESGGVLEHRGLDRLPPDSAADIAKYGWRRLAGWFETHLAIDRPTDTDPIDPIERSSR